MSSTVEDDTPEVVAYQRRGRVVVREVEGHVGTWIEGRGVEVRE